MGVGVAEESGDAVRVGRRALLAAHPVLEDRCQAAAEQQRTKVVELGQREAIGGVELFGEWRQLQGLRQDPDGAWPRVVKGQPHIEVHMGKDRRKIGGLAEVGVAVEEDHIDPQLPEGPDEVGEQRGVDQVQGKVGVPVPGVDLQR